MNKIVIVFVCLAVFETISALECYKCRGSDCEKETKTWEKSTCGTSGVPPYAGHEYACAKITYKDRVSQKEMVTRKCVQAEKKADKIVFNCPQTDGDPISCPVCQTDLCNSAQPITLSLIAMSSVIVAFLLPTFF